MLSLVVFLWLILGAIGFIFWWTKDYDFTSEEIPMLILSIFGPITWIIGYFVHNPKNNKIYFKKRK